MKRFLHIFLIAVFGCAHQIPPSGGPPDTTPPEIVKTFPENGTTNFKEKFIEVEFSEYVDKRSAEESIFISPYLETPPEFKWSGRKLRLIFRSGLKENTTYVVNFGTEIKDLNAGNKMKSSFTLAFSTGSKIDKGSIEGKIYGKADGFSIFAYRIDNLNPDTLSPLNIKPDYIIQVGKDGDFKLTHIKLGTYRIFAINDRYKNFLYDPTIDAYGVFWKDIKLDSAETSAKEINFKTTIEDTSKPFLSSISIPDNSHLFLKFSEKILASGSFSLKIKNNKEVAVKVLQIHPKDSTRMLLIFDSLEQGKYELEIKNLSDFAGNTAEKIVQEFTVPAVSDASPPKLLASFPEDNAESVPLTPEIKLFYDDLLSPESVSLSFSDSAGNAVKISIKIELNTIVIKPEEALKPNMKYIISIFKIADPRGNISKDATRINFTTEDPSQFGAIEGNVSCNDTSTVVVSAISVSSKKVYSVKTKCNGKFLIEKLPQDRYTIEAFIDSDENGKYSFGKVFPFSPSEKLAVYPDTVRVRARWTTEGISIKFK